MTAGLIEAARIAEHQARILDGLSAAELAHGRFNEAAIAAQQASACRGLATTFRAMAEQERTDRITVPVCPRCGTYADVE